MPNYKIEITETLSKIIEIEALSAEETIILAQDKYNMEEIVLNAEDFLDVEIKELFNQPKM